ncbi:MAG: hypothetical protein ACYTG2_06475 [Planctomycetota bacterium]
MTSRAFRNPPVRMLTRLALAGMLALAGCGLFLRQDPIGFRSYPLENVGYADAVSIVQTATRDVCTELFGGVTLTWSPESGNLTVDPIFAGNRRLRLYIHLEPAGTGVDVELFALVDHLSPGGQSIGYTQPMQDVPLEKKLSEAYVAELLRRREAAP